MTRALGVAQDWLGFGLLVCGSLAFWGAFRLLRRRPLTQADRDADDLAARKRGDHGR